MINTIMVLFRMINQVYIPTYRPVSGALKKYKQKLSCVQLLRTSGWSSSNCCHFSGNIKGNTSEDFSCKEKKKYLHHLLVKSELFTFYVVYVANWSSQRELYLYFWEESSGIRVFPNKFSNKQHDNCNNAITSTNQLRN